MKSIKNTENTLIDNGGQIMEQLYVFGTGNAAVSRCYNTCFAIRIQDEFFMVDAGGGNGILKILEDMTYL